MKKSEKFDSFKDNEKEDLYLEIGKFMKHQKAKGEKQIDDEEDDKEEDDEENDDE
ncbi:uncharacterized protein Bfra_009964 [Botrytis fragariae]|uniref:Uncharacterized protein n=1 Tax=Botrytis fragariae TaxID=1964551 RepID=A0A8H6ANL8_9HELO|nr:uncharacterized protein Bfra_009964 [Botrytis fragariae]KAF5870575.1 hypothetical protein Bfra_009964 [Botrytis fragariae]